jgi:DNA-binding NtrC family response regulator
LLSERHDVVDVGSGSEAVASLAALEPDLLLTDIGLPGMQVGELVAAVRARFPRVHVIYMSGRGRHDAQVVAALNVPDARFVAKPIDIDALFAMIEEVLAKRS